MKKISLLTLLITVIFTCPVSGQNHSKAVANGITIPDGYQQWQLISSSYREDNKSLRVILGNDKAMEAALAGQTNPWPDGAILGKLVWKEDRHPKWPAAIIPGDLSHIEFMIKDQARYPETGGRTPGGGSAQTRGVLRRCSDAGSRPMEPPIPPPQ